MAGSKRVSKKMSSLDRRAHMVAESILRGASVRRSLSEDEGEKEYYSDKFETKQDAIDKATEYLNEPIFAGYFPNFCSHPWWIVKVDDKGFTKDDGEFVSWDEDPDYVDQLLTIDDGGDFSEQATGFMSKEEIEATDKWLADAGLPNVGEAWCIYKGDVRYWLAGNCTDNIPELSVTGDGNIELFDDEWYYFKCPANKAKELIDIYNEYSEDPKELIQQLKDKLGVEIKGD